MRIRIRKYAFNPEAVRITNLQKQSSIQRVGDLPRKWVKISASSAMKCLPYNKHMALSERYTDEHAKAGLDFSFPAIETWKNQFPGYEILIDDPEFTSVCPKTGLPDFGIITLRYMPRDLCLELKSYKEYLFTYRNIGIFQENVVNQVLEDVVKACNPVWAVVKGDFRPRGGISTTVEARWPRPETK
jgi:7-cyano-7-deazaguanine reductase